MLTERAAALFNTLERQAQQGLDEIANLRQQLKTLSTENEQLREQLRSPSRASQQGQESTQHAPLPRSSVERGYPLPRRTATPQPGLESATPAPHESPPQPLDDSPQNPLAIDEAPSPQSLLDEWYRRYTDTFFKGHTRPLKVGIHEDLVQREPWPDKLVRRALACYVHLPRYLKAVRAGAERVDLDGQPAGAVSEGEARHAHKKLDSLQAQQREQSQGRKSDHQKPSGLDHKLSELLAKHGRH